MPSNSTADRRVRTTDSGAPPAEGDGDGDDDLPVRRATRVMRLLKLAATTLAALATAAKALGLV
ncbi:hypothetical protein HZS55_02030 [Halosimplex rubrum]|uniref:Uncharacterized protein n=1 Tax=Halosimplex rubrum TaxID=869889 RepID=A0A7D5TB46_9EURY|nr:hypothetical protein [Halosimplex rubrum]QLH76156.1 hypothetical protein HZS55_02030 [Halosimplex rubrum]